MGKEKSVEPSSVSPAIAKQVLAAAFVKLHELKDKLRQAELEENEKLSRRGWGYAQRNVKIGFSTRKSDAIKVRIKKQEEKILELRAIKYMAEQCEDVTREMIYKPSDIKYLVKMVWLDGFRQNDDGTR